jgi:Flp pilus assembly protein TadG
MLPALIQRRGRTVLQRSRENGVTLLLVAVAMFSIIWMAGMSIDVGTLYQASAEAQRSADAAALAGARVLSSSGMTGDPGNSGGKWATICDTATQIAKAVANQNSVGGAVPSKVDVTFIAGDKDSACSASTLVSFGVNPTVTVKVTQSSLPTYFSRVWGRTGSTVSATATAEAFNPSYSKAYAGKVVPVQPRCVKPWIVANYDPLHPVPTGTAPGNYCTRTGTTVCNSLVSASDGSITNAGTFANGTGIIGETFWLVADCLYNQANCTLRDPPPQPNTTKAKHFHAEDPPNLEYLPGQTSFESVGIPSGTTCSGVSGSYSQAIAGCDQKTQYQCGVQNVNYVDLKENPSPNDTPNGVQCLIHSGNGNSGQDTLGLNGATPPVPSYPFQIEIGAGNPLSKVNGIGSTDLITSSTSIVSLPIYDSGAATAFSPGGTAQVTIIGFLQVFINSVDNFGNVSVTVMNVAGCGNAATGTALTGTSPVPVRLITPP